MRSTDWLSAENCSIVTLLSWATARPALVAFGFDPEAIMFAFLFRRRQRRYVWAPAIDFSDRRIAAMLMAFTAR